MKITQETVKNVAKLARLAVSEDDVQHLAPELSEILDYAEQLQQVDLTGIEPTSHSLKLMNVLREDKVRDSLPRDAALKNAPETDAHQVRVPAVLEG